MSATWLARRYGSGAGRILLVPEQRRARVQPRTLRESIAASHRTGEPIDRAVARELATTLPGLVLMSVVLTWLFGVVLIAPPEDSGIRIVPFAPEPPIEIAEAPPQEIVPEPEPVPERVPEPEVVPEPEIAERPPAPPPPPAPARPKPTPKPQIELIARAPKTPPKPEPVRPRRVARQRPAPVAPPLGIDAVAAPEIAEAPPEPVRRAPTFAAARPPDSRPRLDAAAVATPLPRDAAPTLRRRRTAPSPERPAEAPRLALAPAAPATPSDRPAPRRTTRRSPALPPPRRRERGPTVALAVPTGPPERQARPAPAMPTRAERPAPSPPAARQRSNSQRLPGVALGSLAACVSDRNEDALKQKVVAQVGNRVQCKSPMGRYHFVETKNVNAFLLRIERAPSRKGKSADRCAELTFALDCLARSRKEGR